MMIAVIGDWLTRSVCGVGWPVRSANQAEKPWMMPYSGL